jgi:hypothetical protein
LSHSRVAIDTIKGYFYQFDYYILKLLEVPHDSDAVCIEGTEDVDVNTDDETVAIQCKYYAGTEYNHSVIREPIRLMLKHFTDNYSSGHIVKYAIYGHYSSGQNKLSLPFDIQYFKENFLTYKKEKKLHKAYEELELTDEKLTEFMYNLDININAPSYDEQESQILEKLKKQYNVSDFEAEYCYYNNALHEVKRLSIMKNANDRTITKVDFLSRINKKEILFNTWFINKKGIEKYCKIMRKQYFTSYNISPYERFFLIDCDGSVSDVELKTLLQKISKKWSKLSRRMAEPFCPYVFLNNLSDSRLITIKKSLQMDDFYFLDGYDFKDASFFVKSICRKATEHNNIKLKIINKKEQIDDIVNLLNTTREIYQFFMNEQFYENDKHKHIKIPIMKTMDIDAII